jgi:hypothetical protein
MKSAASFSGVLSEWAVRTDGVIDQIVNRLYGLTAEEIRVVEGKG